MIRRWLWIALFAGLTARGLSAERGAAMPPPLPEKARLVLDEDWSGGAIDPARWYALRKKWGTGNNGVVPENVRVERDQVGGVTNNVLVCIAHGDFYNGAVTGYAGARARVGGVLVSKQWFASGRFQVTMKVEGPAGGLAMAAPKGAVPAIWLYGHRAVRVGDANKDRFVPETPLYNPHLKAYGIGLNEYWSEIDFPELGKQGDFAHGLYNTFCQNRHDWRTFALPSIVDARYHTYATEWRTTLRPLPNVTDAQVIEHAGFWWIQDPGVPFELYLGNPLKRHGPDRYSVYAGEVAKHWLDGRQIGENARNVPCMAAQLNLGVWLPAWAGAAPWKTARVSFATVKVWQYGDEGDVHGVLRDDISSNFDEQGTPR